MVFIRLILPCFFLFCNSFESFLEKYSPPFYQDILVHNEVVSQGTDVCEPRYHMLKPILDLYDSSFTVLDLGAAQGYFSFKIAQDYPKSYCIMVDANTWYHDYALHGDILKDLCYLNSHLDNFCYLNKVVTLFELDYLKRHEHFDVILALLVAHLMYDKLSEQVQVIEKLLQLGDNVIIEVANEVAVPFTHYVESLSESLPCQFLGEIPRHKNPHSSSTGKLFWFKSKNKSERSPNLKKETFEIMNKVYPKH